MINNNLSQSGAKRSEASRRAMSYTELKKRLNKIQSLFNYSINNRQRKVVLKELLSPIYGDFRKCDEIVLCWVYENCARSHQRSKAFDLLYPIADGVNYVSNKEEFNIPYEDYLVKVRENNDKINDENELIRQRKEWENRTARLRNNLVPSLRRLNTLGLIKISFSGGYVGTCIDVNITLEGFYKLKSLGYRFDYLTNDNRNARTNYNTVYVPAPPDDVAGEPRS